MTKSKIQQLRDLTETQCSNGNWNYDSYMHGMANAFILALATMEGKEPVFLESPKEWLCDKPIEAAEVNTQGK